MFTDKHRFSHLLSQCKGVIATEEPNRLEKTLNNDSQIPY